MKRRLDLDPLLLDEDTTDRLLGGSVPPPDAPPGYAGVARLLQAVASPPRPAELAGEAEAVAAMVSSLTTPRRLPVMIRHLKSKAAVAALAGGLTLTGGLATAGALPGPLQARASAVLDGLGLDVAGRADLDTPDRPDTSQHGHARPGPARPDADGHSSPAGETPDTPDTPDAPAASDHGTSVSQVARTRPAPEAGNHGQDVCQVASKNRCSAEQPPTEQPPATEDAPQTFDHQLGRCDDRAERLTADEKLDQAARAADKAQDCRARFEAKQAGAADPAPPADPAAPPDDQGQDGDEHGQDGTEHGQDSTEHGRPADAGQAADPRRPADAGRPEGDRPDAGHGEDDTPDTEDGDDLGEVSG